MGGDTLTCGVCKKEFALADIVKFIQHKVLTCNKENYDSGKKAVSQSENGTETAQNDTSSTTTASVTTTTTTSPISATSTLTRRHSISTTTEAVKSLVQDNNNDKVKTEVAKVECVDAESNTVNSGRNFEDFSVRKGAYLV